MDAFEDIINAAILAPSGENCQPWRFEIFSDEISIFNLPERDESLYNWGQKGSLIAHGALLENIKIKASTFGLKPIIKLFPDAFQNHLVAKVKFEALSGKVASPLEASLNTRCTNRKPYKEKALEPQSRAKLIDLSKPFNEVKLSFLEKKSDIKLMAQTAALNERILFENSSMHNFFFNHINWNKEEDRQKSIGFFIETLEMPFPAKFMFKLAKNWQNLQKLNQVGFSKMVAFANAKTYSSCSAIVALIKQNDSNESWILSGQLLQRFWLAATSLKINVQPITGTLFLIRAGLHETEILSRKHIQLLFQAKKDIEKLFETEIENIAMILRVGYGKEPSAKSSRLQPQITYV